MEHRLVHRAHSSNCPTNTAAAAADEQQQQAAASAPARRVGRAVLVAVVVIGVVFLILVRLTLGTVHDSYVVVRLCLLTLAVRLGARVGNHLRVALRVEPVATRATLATVTI